MRLRKCNRSLFLSRFMINNSHFPMPKDRFSSFTSYILSLPSSIFPDILS